MYLPWPDSGHPDTTALCMRTYSAVFATFCWPPDRCSLPDPFITAALTEGAIVWFHNKLSHLKYNQIKFRWQHYETRLHIYYYSFLQSYKAQNYILWTLKCLCLYPNSMILNAFRRFLLSKKKKKKKKKKKLAYTTNNCNTGDISSD